MFTFTLTSHSVDYMLSMALDTLYTVRQKSFSQPPIVQVIAVKKMRDSCHCHHRYTSTMRHIMRKKSIKSHCPNF